MPASTLRVRAAAISTALRDRRARVRRAVAPRRERLPRSLRLERLESRHLLTAGLLDASFGSNGQVTVDFPGPATDMAIDVTVVQPDGKIIVVGDTRHAGGWDFAIARYTAAGELDPSFGSGGQVVYDSGYGNDANSRVLLQPDGKIIVAGNAGSYFAAVRFHADGSVDSTFGDGGIALADVGTNNHVAGAALQSDGKLIVAGGAFDYFVCRFDTNGALDPGFGNGGIYHVGFSGNTADSMYAMTVDSHDRIVAVGNTSGNIAVMRFQSNGFLDPSFHQDGQLLFDMGRNGLDAAFGVTVDADDNPVIAAYTASGNDFYGDFGIAKVSESGTLLFATYTDFGSREGGEAVVVLPDGKMIVAGDTIDGDFALARYHAGGALDTTYGTGGKVLTDFNANSLENLLTMELQDDGKVILVGSSDGDFAIARYNQDGSLDTSFSGDGKLVTNFDGPTVNGSTGIIAVQADGKIIQVGTAEAPSGTDIGLVRYNSDGTLDVSFGSDGRVITDFNAADEAQGVIVLEDGSLVVVGSSAGDFALVRYSSDGVWLGHTLTDFGSNSDIALDVALQSDGKLVLVGATRATPSGSFGYALARYSSDGMLDLSFGTQGKVIIDTSTRAIADYGTSVVVQDDGKIVVAGAGPGPDSDADLLMMRFDSVGNLDTTFGTDGQVTIGLERFYSETAFDLALLPDGKLVAVGGTSRSGRFGGRSEQFVVVRRNPDGSPDESFDDDGTVVTSLGTPNAGAHSVAVDTVGRLVVAGYSFTNENSFDFALARYNTNGSLDTTFGSSGTGFVTTHFSNAQGSSGSIQLPGDIFASSAGDLASSVLIQPDGKILVGGKGGGVGTGMDFALARYLGDDATLTASIEHISEPRVEGTAITLTGAATPVNSGPLTYSWTVHKDGNFFASDEAVALTSFTFTPDDNGSYHVSLTVTGDDGDSSVEATIEVTNANPSVQIEGPDTFVVIAGAPFRFVTADASEVDEAGSFTYTIDWGDGGSPDVITRTRNANVSHEFPQPGTYTIAVTSTDKDGGISDVATHTIDIRPVAQHYDLLIGGTTGSDTIHVWPGSVYVNRNGETLGPFEEPEGAVIIYAFGGADHIFVEAGINAPVEVYGGPGDDSIQVANGVSFIDAGDGDDLIIGGPGINTIIGGAGVNTFFDGGGTNIFLPSPGATVPEVFADAYVTDEDVALVVPAAAGVLANDVSPTGVPRVAALIHGAEHGSVSLNDDGSFTYIPDPGFEGTDSFVYLAQNNAGSSVHVPVTITVNNLVDFSGRVFDDLDNDGVFEPDQGDTGLGGIRIEVYDEAANLRDWTQSAADGQYLLNVNLGAGTYTLLEVLDEWSAGLLDGTETPGSIGGQADNDQDSNTITHIVVGSPGSTADGVDYDFAEIRPSSLFGLVWEDFNNDGEVGFGEMVITNVTVTVDGVDDRGRAVGPLHLSTDADGFYMASVLRPGVYSVRETQPAGYEDGREAVGTVNGVAAGDAFVNDLFAGIVLPQPSSIAENYNFGERPPAGGGVSDGQTAGVGFWQNTNGQELLKSLNGGAHQTQLGDWLAATFPNMYGATAGAHDLTGETNAELANFYRELFRRSKQESEAQGLGGPTKMDAQVLALALATYVTNATLAGTAAESYGFVVTEHGVGTSTFDVADSGEAFAVADGSELTVLDLLFATNHYSSHGVLYDLDGDGDADDDWESLLRQLANDVYSAINERGGN